MAWRSAADAANRQTDVGEVARTSDGGATWVGVGPPNGFRNSVAWIPGLADTAVAVGHRGSDVSDDGGDTWTPIDVAPPVPFLMGVACRSQNACWAVGAPQPAEQTSRPATAASQRDSRSRTEKQQHATASDAREQKRDEAHPGLGPGRVRGADGRQRWIKAVDLRPASGSQP